MKIAILINVIIILSTTFATNYVQFYDSAYFKGSSITLTMNDVQCTNLPENFKSKASSLNSIGNARCGYIYELDDCKGKKKVRVERYSWKGDDFKNAGLNNQVRSYRNCNPDGKQRIYINDQPNYQGQSYYLDLPQDGSCVTLAPPHDSITSSIYIYNYCIIVWDNKYCNGKPLRLDCDSLAHDLSFYNMDNKIKSFQLCYGADVGDINIERTK